MSDPVQDAVLALGAGNVYVSPEVAVPPATSGTLAKTLTGDDQIVLVMLPASAATSTRSPEQIAATLSQATGGTKIVGLSVGDTLVGQADRFGPGVPTDMMSRADSINNDATGALTTYVLLVHRYQQTEAGRTAMHPPVTSQQQPPAAPVDGGLGIGTDLAIMLPVVLVLAAAGFVLRRFWRKRTSPARVQAAASQLDRLRAGLRAFPDPATLPAAARQPFREITSDLGDLLDNWSRASRTDVAAEEIEKVVLEYVPTLVQLYASVPPDLRGTPRSPREPTPDATVVEQVETMARYVGSVRDAAYSGAVDALEVQAAVLRSLYPESSLPVSDLR